MASSTIKSLLNLALIIGVGYYSYWWGVSDIEDGSKKVNSEESPDIPGKITLYYFDVKWTTETTRLLLKYGGLDFTDKRIKEEWPELKSTTPFGHLPVIEVDGKMAPQSIAIARYVAKKVKLTGANDWEDLLIDGIVDTLSDIKDKLAKIFEAEDDAAKKTFRENHLKETIPYYFEKLDEMAKKNNGYLVGKKLTWADFYFTVAYDLYVGLLEKDFIKAYPNLANVRNNVLKISAVKSWIDTRPKTDF